MMDALARQLATDGTASPSACAVTPSTYKNRSSDRSLVVIAFAEPTLQRSHSANTNRVTSAVVKVSKSGRASPDSDDKKARATSM
jgi:hypothetical protein